MAASGFTPLALYYSSTATNTPSAGNLTSGELAINITDGNLFYKDNSGVVQVIANKNATNGIFPGNGSFGGTGQLQLPAGTSAQRSGLPAAGYIRYNNETNLFEGYSALAGVTISTITFVTTTATLTTATAHGVTTGTIITVTGASPSAYNGTFSITVTSPTTFTYTMLSNPGANATVVGSYTSGFWGTIGGGGSVAGGAMIQNLQTISISYAIPSGSSAMSTGPMTITSGHFVTVPSGSKWVVL
ncbi:hypothetical protein UFOVP118_74 [uncultured Caudovirales phage]|uniref:Uncharacterized protein n=1 Tax=uncultured Caudovirales phage TaxID=2100421 RepID=A0A6J5L648_9CAUD|nr:hypothetical protein UFOVP118_74 [uncultured Caudovirales phage]